MRLYELKSRIILEWDRWVQTQLIDPRGPTARDTLRFFVELQDRRSPLLDFRTGGRDRWQVIHEWLQAEGRVSEVASHARPPIRRGRAASPPRAAGNKKRS